MDSASRWKRRPAPALAARVGSIALRATAPFELGVLGLVDDAHAAMAQNSEDAIGAKPSQFILGLGRHQEIGEARLSGGVVAIRHRFSRLRRWRRRGRTGPRTALEEPGWALSSAPRLATMTLAAGIPVSCISPTSTSPVESAARCVGSHRTLVRVSLLPNALLSCSRHELHCKTCCSRFATSISGSPPRNICSRSAADGQVAIDIASPPDMCPTIQLIRVQSA